MRGDGLRNRLTLARAKRRSPGLTVGTGVKLDSSARIKTQGEDRVILADESILESGVVLYTWGGAITVGRRTLLGPYCVLYGAGGVTIGDDVLVAAHTVLVAGNHRFDRLDLPIREQGDDLNGVQIESDVWIGAHVVILDGVTIGQGSVIAAGAVVSKNIPPFSVAVGVPARVISDRRMAM